MIVCDISSLREDGDAYPEWLQNGFDSTTAWEEAVEEDEFVLPASLTRRSASRTQSRSWKLLNNRRHSSRSRDTSSESTRPKCYRARPSSASRSGSTSRRSCSSTSRRVAPSSTHGCAKPQRRLLQPRRTQGVANDDESTDEGENSDEASVACDSWDLSVTDSCGMTCTISTVDLSDCLAEVVGAEAELSCSDEEVGTSSTHCTRCLESYKGFGHVCASCRKFGRKSDFKQCQVCDSFFGGFGATCRECPLPQRSLDSQGTLEFDGVMGTCSTVSLL